MNHHADKVVDPLTEDELALVDPELGALFHRVIGTLVRLIEPRR